ncbi:MAG: 4-hydroxybenzoate polyprenyltransferase-like prenyltransferase [Chitinophagaceae bacterium]|nr:4-hydroxybenzoate polyprenyltransferase-like prenyltransferase [Chitinophagaceae bacterium]
MKYLINIRDFFILGHVWLALCAVAQGLLTFHLIQATISLPVCAILFLATFFIYNIRALYDSSLRGEQKKTAPLHVRWMSSHLHMLWGLSSLAAIGILIFTWMLKEKTIVVFSITGLLALSYSIPLLSSKGGLRQLPGFKAFLIGIVWTLSTVLIPVMESTLVMDAAQVTVLMIKRFTLFFVLALVCDIRDEQTDREHQLHTIATYLGAAKARMLCLGLLVIEEFIIYTYDYNLDRDVFYRLTLFTLLTAVVVWSTKYTKNVFYYLFVADGMTMLQYVLVCMVLV